MKEEIINKLDNMELYILNSIESKYALENAKLYFKELRALIDKNNDIICPYCGCCHEDGYSKAFYEPGTHDFKCVRCENKFNVETEISFHYSTSKKEEL